MEPVLTPDEMRAADAATIDGGVPGAELMDRAAHACAAVALRMLGGAYGKRIVVVAGKGNNGGDGIACARHLAVAGASATVFLVDEPSGDAAHHLDLARTTAPRGRFRAEPWSTAAFERAADRADVIVDALLGTGFSGAPRFEVADAIAAINAADGPVLAVDIPSGVSGADGRVPDDAVAADVTVAIQALKIGHVVTPGVFRCGRIDVAEIGIATEAPRTFVPQAPDVFAALPPPEPDTHKYRVGALAILAGSSGMTGAAILTAQGAIRSGAGLVILGVPSSTLEIFESSVTEAIKVPLPEVEGRLDAKAVDEFGDRLERCRALAVGPGLGRGPQAVALVRRALDVGLPVVVDGDGLWALGEILGEEPDLLAEREYATVLTPHSGEFGYLGGDTEATDRVAAVRDLAERLGAVVHLKGRRALTAWADGTVWVNTSGNPGLATGGTGDVLTGIVASLIAQGAVATDATWAGAYLHGLAGDVAAGRLGRRSLAARDVPEALAAALREVHRMQRPSGTIRTVAGPAT
jgi:NAD(P)H-hydrate epimerase